MSDPQELPEGSVLFFPEGLPGFESSRYFILMRHDEFDPVLLLQSVENEKLSVPVVPVQFVDPEYKLEVPAADCAPLEFPKPPRLHENVLCLLVLVLGGQGSTPKCNLFAPIVINTAKLRGKQVMQIGSNYPSVFPLADAAAGSAPGE